MAIISAEARLISRIEPLRNTDPDLYEALTAMGRNLTELTNLVNKRAGGNISGEQFKDVPHPVEDHLALYCYNKKGIRKARIDDVLAGGYQGYAFSSGQSNAVGGGDTILSNFDYIIKANLLDQPGDCLMVIGTVSCPTASTNAKALKLQIDSAGVQVIFTTSTSLASMVVPFCIFIRYRTTTTGISTGRTLIDSIATGVTGVDYLMHGAI